MKSLFVLLYFALSVPASGQTRPLYVIPIRFDELLGSQRLPDKRLDESRTPASVTVLTREDIRGSGAKTLQELLSARGLANAFDETGNGFQSTLDLRGFNSSPAPATIVVVDGSRVNEASMGQVNYHLIPLENIERVEVHRGPNTLYGKDALAGVVHITTRRQTKQGLSGEMGAGAGSFSRRKAWAWGSGRSGDFDYFISGTKETERGYRSHSAADLGTAMVKLGYRHEDQTDISASYARADDDLEQAGSLTAAEARWDPRRNISEVRTVSRVDFFQYNMRQALPWDFSIALNGHLRGRREDTPMNRGRTSVSKSLADMRTRGLTGQLSLDKERLMASAGVEGGRRRADIQSHGDFGGWPFNSGKHVKDDTRALFLQAAFDLLPETLVLSAGVRHDQSRMRLMDRVDPAQDGSAEFRRTCPKVGLNLNHPSGAGAYASYAESFRAPTANELAVLGPFGSVMLGPVKARSYELGGRFGTGDALSSRISLFRTDVQDEIFPVFDPTAGFGRNINVDLTRREGVEWSLSASAGMLDGGLDYAWTRSVFLREMSLDKAPWPATQRVRPGDSLPGVPRHTLSARVGVTPLGGWRVSMNSRCASSRHLFGDESNTEPALPGFCVLGLGTSYERSGWTAAIAADNILDKRYQTRGILASNPTTWDKDVYVVPAPGISVFATLRWRWEMKPSGSDERLSMDNPMFPGRRSSNPPIDHESPPQWR
ncbi:MAG: TonB-dependent receptor [Elusimicrobiota bacterium]